ncbi:hypothetical protein [Tautonia sociabilis]|uniref:DUF2382 domain-containing protein n=1 Tax=Tautonia sociabilis TaxID=2080755 RepID=A0A432MN89_9BACT|nr:hypothetical protein [Tautonia sociabilis]RUL88538.1 hypothetical protein TsocGM_06345 [Tautonia sociabilis]
MNPSRLLVAALLAAPLSLAGCAGDDAEQAVEELSGVEPGTASRTADVDEKTYIVEQTDRIIDRQTGEVVGEEVSRTDVTVTEQVEVTRDVDVEAGETTTRTEGQVPDGLGDH